MVPVRAVAEALDFELTWDAQTSSATIFNSEITSTVHLGTITTLQKASPHQVSLIQKNLALPQDWFMAQLMSQQIISTYSLAVQKL